MQYAEFTAAEIGFYAAYDNGTQIGEVGISGTGFTIPEPELVMWVSNSAFSR